LPCDEALDVLEPEAVPAVGAEAYRREITVSDELPNPLRVYAKDAGHLFRAE